MYIEDEHQIYPLNVFAILFKILKLRSEKYKWVLIAEYLMQSFVLCN